MTCLPILPTCFIKTFHMYHLTVKNIFDMPLLGRKGGACGLLKHFIRIYQLLCAGEICTIMMASAWKWSGDVWEMCLFLNGPNHRVWFMAGLLKWASPMAQQVKNPHAMQEMQKTRVQSLEWEDPPPRIERQPTPVFLPEKSHGQRSLEGHSPKGDKE